MTSPSIIHTQPLDILLGVNGARAKDIVMVWMATDKEQEKEVVRGTSGMTLVVLDQQNKLRHVS